MGVLVVAILALVALGIALARGSDAPPLSETVKPSAGDIGSRRNDRPAAPPVVRKVRTVEFGAGAQAVAVLRPEPALERPPAILFLHGWGLKRVNDYGPWLRHLVRAGNVVIFPRYQLSESSNPGNSRRNVLAGLRLALRRVPIDRASLVVAGHSAGAAMAADYAAISGTRGLPRPLAVFSVYPGRAFIGYPAGIPAADYRRIAPSTRLVVMAGSNDVVVAQAPALSIFRGATRIPRSRRRYVLVTAPGVSGHYGPTRSTSVARAAFWRPLDRLIARARR